MVGHLHRRPQLVRAGLGAAPSPIDHLPSFKTSESPAVAVFDGRLQLFWKGADDLGIWRAEASSFVVAGQIGLHWLNHERLGFVEPAAAGSLDLTRNAPAALAMQRLYLAGQKPHDDGIFVWSRGQGEGWNPDSPDSVDVPGVGTSNGPALVANATTFVGEPDKLLMFWKGMDDLTHNPVRPGERHIPNVGTSHRPALAVF